MRYLVWALRLLVFVAVLMFALKNTNPVEVRFYADYVVQDVPLIVVMLVVFVLGALFGLLLTVPAAAPPRGHAPAPRTRPRAGRRERHDAVRAAGSRGAHVAASGAGSPAKRCT